MITALVKFKLPQPMSREKAKEVFLGTAPGAPPSITYFESPVVVDNLANEIVSDS